jgi:hypothetical protein
MPYTVNLFEVDLGGFIGLGTALSGTFVNEGPSRGTDRATAAAAAPRTLAFMSATPPPPGSATLHVANSGPTGDLFRSGRLTGLPPSPGILTVYSVPTGLTRFTATTLAALLRPRVATISLAPPLWISILMGLLSLGTYIPVTGVLTSIVPTFTGMPAGTMTLTLTGFFTFRAYYFWTDTIAFTGTIIATPAPSGDVLRSSRVLSVPCAVRLATTTTGPSPTLALTGLFLSLLAPVFAPAAQALVEDAVNTGIDGAVAPALGSLGFRRSPSSVVSARSVVVTGAGMALSLVLADLFGAGVVRIPSNLRAAISPPPKAGGPQPYTVTVTDMASGASVDQADVTVENYTATGAAQTLGPQPTNANGQTTFTVALRFKVVTAVDPETHEHEPVFLPPTLTVSKAGYNTIHLRLLEPLEQP